MTKYEEVKKEALEHFEKNGRSEKIWIIKNDEGFYYCKVRDFEKLIANDFNNRKNPQAIGYYVEELKGPRYIEMNYTNLH